MKKLGFVWMFIAGVNCGAESTITVDRIEGNRAIVTFDDKVTLKVGEVLTKSGKDALDKELEGEMVVGRPRDWGMNYAASVVNSNEDGGSSETFSKSKIGFFKNLGIFEAGLDVAIELFRGSGIKSDFTAFTGIGKLNFVRNVAPNRFIPYSKIFLGTMSLNADDVNTNGSESATVAGTGLGLNWFPFGDIFALDLSVQYRAVFAERSTIDNVDLNAGWSVYF